MAVPFRLYLITDRARMKPGPEQALTAALGAKTALPDRTVVAIVGDGCFQMCGMELATAVQERLPVVSVVVNDGALTLIKAIQQRRYESRFLGVDLLNPDFGTFAQAFGVRYRRADDDAAGQEIVRGLCTSIPSARLWRYDLRAPLTPRYEEQDLDALLLDLDRDQPSGAGLWDRESQNPLLDGASTCRLRSRRRSRARRRRA